MTERCAIIDCLSVNMEETQEQQEIVETDKHGLQLSLQQYDKLLQSLPNGLVLISKVGNIAHINAQMEKMFGYRKEELLGKNIEILMPERFRVRHRKHVENYVANPHVRPMGSGIELFGLRKDGTEFPIDISLSYLTTNGELFPMAVVRDITEQKNAQHKIALNYLIQKTISSVLKISLEPISLEERLSRVLDLILTIPGFAMHARGSIYRLAQDQDKKILELKAMHGFSVEQVDSCKAVFFQKGLTVEHAASCQIITTDCLEVPHEIQYNTGLGSEGQYCVPIVFGERTLGMINVTVTGRHRRIPEEEEFLAAIANSLAGLIERHDSEMEKSRLREQLNESEKLAALGRITANVSHTIKNPLMAIGGFANRLLDKLPEGTKEKKYAGLIFTEAVRLENVLQNVLLFSRRDAKHKEECNVHEIIGRALMMYEDICREKSILVSSHFADVPAFFGNKEQILQAVENLLSNAIDAMPQGGTLTVGIDEEQVHGTSYLAIRVQDTGQGIEAENINRIFEPFFTTKLILKGTGLGLSITKKVVEEHNGFIRVDSKIGIGTTFSLFFPRDGAV